jgi:hypothetical protein
MDENWFNIYHFIWSGNDREWVVHCEMWQRVVMLMMPSPFIFHSALQMTGSELCIVECGSLAESGDADDVSILSFFSSGNDSLWVLYQGRI